MCKSTRVTPSCRDIERSLDVRFKYIDPSYMTRGVSANPQDSIYGAHLAQNAVHAAMAGKTKWPWDVGMDIMCMGQSALLLQGASRSIPKGTSGIR